MKKILLWDLRFPERRPARLTVDDALASAAVRAGVAAAADPAEQGALANGAPLDPGLLSEVVLEHGFQKQLVRVILPYSVVLIGAAAGVLAAIGTPVAAAAPPLPPPPPPPPPPVLTPPADPIPTADMLPLLTRAGLNYRNVFSTERLIEGSGPLAYLGNAMTNAGAYNVGAGNTGITAADLTSSTMSVYAWYDQTDSSRYIFQETLANRPRLRGDVKLGGRLAVAFWGKANDVTKRTTMSGPTSQPIRNTTRVIVVHPTVSRQGLGLSSTSDGTNNAHYTFIGGDGAQGRFAVDGTYQPPRIPSSPQVLIIAHDNADNITIWIDGVKSTGTTGSSAVVANTLILGQYGGSDAFNANMRMGAHFDITGVVNDAEAASITEALTGRFGLAPDYEVNLIHVGDSIVEGAKDTDTIGLGQQMIPLLNKRTRYWNLGIAGKTLAAMYADRADMIPALLQPGKTNVVLIDGGINDVNNGSVSVGANLYTGTTTPFIAYLKGLGCMVGAVPLLPQRPAGQTSQWYADHEALRQSYNGALLANGGGADFVVDRASEPHMGTYPTSPNDPTLYQDGLHPTSLGYGWLAPVYVASINGVIA